MLDASQLEQLFPLPMSSIEKFHWLDTNDDYPNLIFARLRFHGRLDAALAKQAFQFIAGNQPLAHACPKLIGGRWHWVVSEDPNFLERCFEHRVLDDDQTRSWTNSPQNGFRTFCLSIVELPVSAKGGCITEARFHTHHALSDGVGCVAMVNAWMTAYQNLICGVAVNSGVASVDSAKLKDRSNLGLSRWRYIKHLPKQAVALFGAAKFIFRKTRPLLPSTDTPPAGDTPFPQIIGCWVDSDSYEIGKATATRMGVTFPAWCMAKRFAAIGQFGSTESSNDKRAFRIILPMSVRNPADRDLPACNRTSLVQIDRASSGASDNPDVFCQQIDREIKIIRGWQLEKMFLISIRMLSVSNRWLKRVANSPKSRGAAVFTHLGQPLKKATIHAKRLRQTDETSGSLLQLESADFAGPVRTGTPANVSISRIGQKLRLSLHYDAISLSAEQAAELLELYRQLLSAQP